MNVTGVKSEKFNEKRKQNMKYAEGYGIISKFRQGTTKHQSI